MCGIAGFWQFSADSVQQDMEAVARAMCSSLKHRGPDGQGFWIEPKAGIGLAHTRLAIIDLTENGAQPMHSASGRYAITYNGELYNFRQLKADLISQGVGFRGHSDTEVILEAIECWGIHQALTRFVGMFAFALWDKRDRRLFLARDRIGEKPLYYGVSRGTFLFGSELKALKTHPHWLGDVDRDALTLYFRHNYIPEPYSIYQDIAKLEPGHFLCVGGRSDLSSEPVHSGARTEVYQGKHCYWSLDESYHREVSTVRDSQELINQLDQLLHQSIKGQMISDVPLGALLSGGIDSSTVAAIMQDQSENPVKTFSIGFEEEEYNEAKYAAAVARHLGTDHTELYVTPEETREVIPCLPDLYDEPFSDSSQIPTWLVSRLVREQVIVCLSGDGGDELFAGYDRYYWARKIWKSMGWMPRPIRSLAAGCITAIPQSAWDSVLTPLSICNERLASMRNLGHKAHRFAATLNSRKNLDLYKMLVSHWLWPECLVLGSKEPHTQFDRAIEKSGRAYIEQMMYLDTLSYLPGDILTKVDRASMSVGLEVRVPFLDHRIIEFAWSVPMSYKIRDDKTKWLLRQVLDRYVPQHMIDRPKMGFAVPVGQWLRGPLKDWAEDLLSETEIKKHGFLESRMIREKWREHLLGQRDWAYHLWDVLMFQSWLRSAH